MILSSTESSPTPPLCAASYHSLDLGVIGNCAFSALIDKMGCVVWSCLPRFDSDPVFNALIDTSDHAGLWSIKLENYAYSEQFYEPNTAVLRTRLYDTKGQGIEITDFAPRFYSRGQHFRPITIVRRVKPLEGAVRITIQLRPRFNWGRLIPMITQDSQHIRYVGSSQMLRLTTDAPLSYIVSEQKFLLDRKVNFILGSDEVLAKSIENTAHDFEQDTIQYWRMWSSRLAISLEWQDAVIRAAITLKLSLFEDTGAIIAAMTTSIPEAPNSSRNWDYRYCWLRDAFFVVRALNSLSEVSTMEDYLRWLRNIILRSKGGHIKPLYGIGLEESLPESIVQHLSGYRGQTPVRVGNQAYEHFQHDVYGNIILGAAQAFYDRRLIRPAGLFEFKHLEAVGENAYQIYRKPDAGMWELRSRARIHTSSVLMNWAACDRLSKIASTLRLPEREMLWRKRADSIREYLLNNAWNKERGAFAESIGGRDLDASVLLMAEVNIINAQDPRFISTVEALEKSLCDGPYMRRYEAPDDFGKPETAFNICTFWRIDALARIGRRKEARSIFEAMLAARNHLGLLSEDTHPITGEMWGNFPQTYSMVGIINCAMRLSEPWDSVI
ncbi:glycoside hydrolase family 15 protein [Candidatus Vallotiella sp. (ex Adelges kitamiensis)]|uniref:glycoside hydrolase family 15 protein n=1 Tax=Candidatus Vallotiella sp. (ex Adelges kitamiensis) TaxID=2864217 RepID=UPI001CE2691E|nr:glycoside hydrolase family 15 protein [Candidatus Vallotia sp. (ex Adelges kitamiensis)]